MSKSNESQRLVNECVAAHNSYRVLHQSPPCTLSLELCTMAYNMAMALSIEGALIYDDDCPYGQNLYKQNGKIQDGKIPVKSWYLRGKTYNYNRPGLLLRARDFTQVVWAASTELGVAFYTNNGMSYVVVLYNPRGNIEGEFSKNVKPPSKNTFIMWTREFLWNVFYYMTIYDLRWSWSSSGCNSGRQTCYKKTVTTYTSDGRQIVTTYEGGQPIGAAQTATCPGNVTNHAGASNHNVTSCIAPKGGFTQFELECLEEHNNLRARHGCPPLKLNRNLSSFANEWAQYLLSRNMLQHRSNNKGGENLLFCYLCEIF